MDIEEKKMKYVSLGVDLSKFMHNYVTLYFLRSICPWLLFLFDPFLPNEKHTTVSFEWEL